MSEIKKKSLVRSNGLRVVPRAKGSAVVEGLEAQIGAARDIGATSFAIVMEGPEGFIYTDWMSLGDRFRFVGALEKLKSELLDG